MTTVIAPPAVAQTGRAHIQLFAQHDSAPVRWRLLGGNNRELGRGTGEFDDVESCALGVKQLQNALRKLDHGVQRLPNNTWKWTLSLGGVMVASSGHRYDRLIRCRQALNHFTVQFESSEIGRTVMISHSRRRGVSAHHAPAEKQARS